MSDDLKTLQASADHALEALSRATGSTAAGAGGQPWNPLLISFLTVVVIGFSGFVLHYMQSMLKDGPAAGDVLRLATMPMVVAAAIFLVLLGFSNEQMTPAPEDHFRMAEEENSLSWWVGRGSDLAGQIAGGVASPASLNPVLGVGVGFAVTESLRKIGNEIRKWKLGPREERRVGAIFVYTTCALERRLLAGEQRSRTRQQRNDESRLRKVDKRPAGRGLVGRDGRTARGGVHCIGCFLTKRLLSTRFIVDCTKGCADPLSLPVALAVVGAPSPSRSASIEHPFSETTGDYFWRRCFCPSPLSSPLFWFIPFKENLTMTLFLSLTSLVTSPHRDVMLASHGQTQRHYV